MSVLIKEDRLLVKNVPYFIQGMNLFLDDTILEKHPRKIYFPPLVSDALIERIIPYLLRLGINTVRIWPRSTNKSHQAQISERAFSLLADAGLYIILNLPVNWNLKPSLASLKNYVKRYSAKKFENILLYCINNEAYHGLISPGRYTRAVHYLTRRYGHRPTLLTNANLNHPWLFSADVIGADFFTYRYSISQDGPQDVGAVSRMFCEDAFNTYRFFPKSILTYHYLVDRYLAEMAKKRENFDPTYFQKNLFKLLRRTQKHHKPYIIAEYGYTRHPEQLDEIYAYMPIREMHGHIWYNWTNFDPSVEGTIANQPLYEKFHEVCQKMKKVKELQGFSLELYKSF